MIFVQVIFEKQKASKIRQYQQGMFDIHSLIAAAAAVKVAATGVERREKQEGGGS